MICNNEQTKHRYTKSGIKLFICNNCNFMFVHPIPSIETQQKYYNESYDEGTYEVYSDQEKLRKKLNELRLKEIEKYIPEGKLLDVGCATGYFLDAAKNYGLETFGVELSEKAVQQVMLRHKNIFQGAVEDANFNDSTFDFITIFDLIEHVTDPDSTIKEVSRIIKQGRHIAISTPDITSWHAKILGKRWGFIIPLEHLFYFSPNSMKLLLKKHGFSIVTVRKNYKIFTIHDILRMAEFYYPKNLVNIISKFFSIFPKKFLNKERTFYFGEMLVIAKKT